MVPPERRQQSATSAPAPAETLGDAAIAVATAAGGPGTPGSVATQSSTNERVVLNHVAIQRALMRIGHEIVERYDDLSDVYLVAIPNGGVPLARVLVENIAKIAEATIPLGILDTTLYRDDVIVTGERPRLRVTEMPSSVDDKVVVLVEDVVNTGRTIRAAMDALMDFGRPRIVQVVALVDRGHRELPIRIDYVGKNIPTQPGEVVTLKSRDTGRVGEDVLQGPLQVVLERPQAGS